MEAMKENGITAVATTDPHFTQAGFRVLLGKG
jgi:predicted nucleic acid-binding protein